MHFDRAGMERMMKNILRRKLNNSGSTLVIAIIAIGFVAILGTIVLTAAVTNAKLKSMDKQSKESFYNAETAVEYIYAKLGEQCMTSIQQSYSDVSSNLLTQVNVGGKVYYVQKENDVANVEMKNEFFKKVITIFSTNTVPSKDEVVKVFNEYLASAGTKNCDNAEVVSISDVNFGESLVFKDVLVQYKNPVTNYYSTVKVDMAVEYPKMTIDFTNKSAAAPTSFINYSMIAMKDIDFGYYGSGLDNAAKVTLRGDIFAGNNINVQSGSNLEVKALIDSDVTSTSNMIAGKDINITGGESKNSILNIYKANVWCNNYNLDTGSTGKIGNLNFNTGNESNAYVADDLNIIGNKCTATLGNNYFGYGNGDTDDTSSAIIVNGKNAVLNLITLKKLVLGGRAYIDFSVAGTSSAATPYLTADSIALKGNQEIYLVPAKYFSSKDGSSIRETNPLNATKAQIESEVTIDMNGFFAYDLGLLDTTSPYTIKAVTNKMCYVYLNFKDNKTSTDYVKSILDEDYLKSLYSKAGRSYTEQAGTDRSNLYLVIDKSLKKFITDGKIGLTLSDDASVYSSGTLLQVSNDNKMSDFETDDVSIIPADKLGLTCTDISTRYKVLKSFLVDIGTATLLSDIPAEIEIDGQMYKTDDVGSKTAYERIINVKDLSEKDKNYISYSDVDHKKITAVVTNNDPSTASGKYVIPAGVNSGVILGYNVDIYVSENFEGLIITNKSVHVSGDNTIITTGTTDLASQLLDSNSNVSKYFLSYATSASGTAEDDNISKISVKDVLSMDNWRKNDGE